MRGFGRRSVRRLGTPIEPSPTSIDGRGERIPLVYRLVADDHGWPPVDAEKLWVAPQGHDLFRIDNIPFFVQNLAQGDVVRAVPVSGYLLPLSRVSWGGNRTVRIRPRPRGPIGEDLQVIFDLFVPLGVEAEGDPRHLLAALNVPAPIDPTPIRELLQQGTSDGWWDHEESCVDPGWYRNEPARGAGT